MAARGGQLIRVPAAYSSQDCPACGHTAHATRPTRERFCCVECGYEKMVEVKAAETIEDRGRVQIELPLRQQTA